MLDASEAIEAASSKLPGLDHLHPSKLFEQLDIAAENEKDLIAEKLTHWIKCAIKYHGQFDSFGHNDVVDFLQTKLNWNAKQLVKFFVSLRSSSGIQEDHFVALQKALSDKFSLDDILPLWLDSNINPREVYQMMSIPTDGLFTSDGKETAAWEGVKGKLIRLMRYIDNFHGESLSYPFKLLEGNFPIFSLFAEFRQPKELLILFTSLPAGWEQRANDLQKRLYQSFPQNRPKLIKIWLELGRTPEDVYGLMLLDSRVEYSVKFVEPTKWAAMCDVNMEWVLYTDKYMDRSIIFSNSNDMNGLLRKELIKNIVTDLRDNAVAAQQKIEEVGRLMRDHTVSLLLDVYPVPWGIPDKAIAELLEDEAMAERVKDRAIADLLRKQTINIDAAAVFFHALRYYHTDWMFRADRMQQQLLTRCSEETEKVVFGLFLTSRLSPKDVYHMMPFASMKSFAPVNGRTES